MNGAHRLVRLETHYRSTPAGDRTSDEIDTEYLDLLEALRANYAAAGDPEDDLVRDLARAVHEGSPTKTVAEAEAEVRESLRRLGPPGGPRIPYSERRRPWSGSRSDLMSRRMWTFEALSTDFMRERADKRLCEWLEDFMMEGLSRAEAEAKLVAERDTEAERVVVRRLLAQVRPRGYYRVSLTEMAPPARQKRSRTA